MSQTVNFKWPQGEDLEISLIYKEGNSEWSASAVNLSSGYEARMDIVLPAGRLWLYTANSGDEITLGTGADNNPNIVVWMPRSLTMSGGALFANLGTTTNFNYDLFLRNTSIDPPNGRQIKVLSGQINIERSNTLWV